MKIHPFTFVPILSLLVWISVSRAGAAEDERPVENAAKHALDPRPKNALPTIFLEGDSTVRVGSPNQRGWGDELAPFFDATKINVVNHAIGGRSSRTFQTEGRWDGSLAMIQKGDFVICQFGHNDNGPTNDNSRARGTIKGTGEETEEIDNILTHQHEVVHTYGWYMRKYAHDAKAKGIGRTARWAATFMASGHARPPPPRASFLSISTKSSLKVTRRWGLKRWKPSSAIRTRTRASKALNSMPRAWWQV